MWENKGAFSLGGEGVRGPARGRMRGESAEIARLKGDRANFALISRLRAAASVSALRAAFGGCAPTRACGRSPSGKAFRTGGAFSLGGEGVRGPARGRMRGESAEVVRLKGGHTNSALISRLRAAASPEGEAFKE